MRNVEFTGVILAATCGQRLFPLTQAVNNTQDDSDSDSDDNSDSDSDSDNNSHKDNLDDTWSGYRSDEETNNKTTPASNKKNDPTNKLQLYMPKHLLPLAGRPLIHHLLEHCIGVGMERIIIAIGADDHLVTKSSLVQMGCTACTDATTSSSSSTASPSRQESNTNTNEEAVSHPSNIHTTELKYGNASITVITMPKECNGSADAMRCIIAADIIETQSHVMVLPADLVLYGNMTDANNNNTNDHANANDNYNNAGNGNGDQEQDHVIADALGSLADVHRREYRVGVEKGMPLGMSLLLADVGEEDESGVPLKESSKVC